MDRQAVLLSDEKLHDLESYSDDCKDGQETITFVQPCSMRSESKVAASPIGSFAKWVLVCILVFLAMTFTLELLEPHAGRAR